MDCWSRRNAVVEGGAAVDEAVGITGTGVLLEATEKRADDGRGDEALQEVEAVVATTEVRPVNC